MGELFRRFWLPAMLPSELPKPDCPPVPLRLLGEDLIAFRDSNGEIGVVEAHCPHRGASLYFGRNEECGIRCVSTMAGNLMSPATASTCLPNPREQLQREDPHHGLPDGPPRRPELGLYGTQTSPRRATPIGVNPCPR